MDSGAIDKLEVRIPREARFHPEFGKIFVDVGGDPKHFRESMHYQKTGDLRPFGFDAMVHLFCKHGKKPNHKVELLETGKLSYAAMINEIEKIFEVTAGRLDVTRIDLTVDVPNVPVDWFKRHCRIAWKRRTSEIGEYMTISQGVGETLYFGKRPNCFRIYNKTAERIEQHKKLEKICSKDAELPDFEQTFGHKTTAVITRFERQIGGGRVPDAIANVSRLRNLPNFNPFESVEILSGNVGQVPDLQDVGFQTYYSGLYWRQQVQEVGLQRAKQLIRIATGTNANYHLAKLEKFLAISESETLAVSDLLDRFKSSVTKQLAN